MLLLLSPAKTMTGTSQLKAPAPTTPRFEREAAEIALQMAQFPIDELGRLLKLNPRLAVESYRRFQDFHGDATSPLQALLAYTGVVFKHIRPDDFSREDFEYAQAHLRIVSIAYGLLRPLDGIKPYRMEYDVKLPEPGDGTMYAFWRERLTPALIGEVKQAGGVLANLASQEVQPAFDWKKVEQSVRVVTPEFKIWKNGKARTIVIYAKMARGQMARYLLKNRFDDPEAMKEFRWEGFTYQESLSEANRWVFLQA